MSDLLTRGGATFSACRAYRYRLWRIWDEAAPPLVMLMLNPSTADDVENDATVERCERRARTGGFGRLDVLNIFAFRSTDPALMKAASDPVGPANDWHIDGVLRLVREKGGLVCAGWGVHGEHRNRDLDVVRMARGAGVVLHCLGVTKDDRPRHPLYVGYGEAFRPWRS